MPAGRARLPTEAEWEVAAGSITLNASANLLAADHLHPVPAPAGDVLRQMFGDVWEWTSSAYLGYPGYRPPEGAVGEYNGKFMSGQMVLRVCAISESRVWRSADLAGSGGGFFLNFNG